MEVPVVAVAAIIPEDTAVRTAMVAIIIATQVIAAPIVMEVIIIVHTDIRQRIPMADITVQTLVIVARIAMEDIIIPTLDIQVLTAMEGIITAVAAENNYIETRLPQCLSFRKSFS